MEKETQISAHVSVETRELLERYTRATGVKKGHLIEQALRHHLQALEALPLDMIIHPRVVLSRKSGAVFVREVTRGKANAALRKLMRDGD